MSIWQTKSWWDMLVSSNQAEKIIEVDWIFIEKRKVGMWEYWLFVLWLENNLDEQNVKELIETCKKEKAMFLQIENLDYSWKWSFSIDILKKWYYKKFITPYTAVVDLEKTEDEILAKMKPKGRYNIKLASKKWVEIKKVEKTDANIEKFYELMKQTTSRDNFSWNNIEYYKTFLNNISSSELLLAYVDDTVIAWWIFVFEKEVSIYYYWASTSDKKYRNLMAPYLLQWEAIKLAKTNWSKYYDFLWVAGPNEKNSSLSWVTNFKLKLTADVREVSDSYIWINKKLKYFFIDILRKIRKK